RNRFTRAGPWLSAGHRGSSAAAKVARRVSDFHGVATPGRLFAVSIGCDIAARSCPVAFLSYSALTQTPQGIIHGRARSGYHQATTALEPACSDRRRASKLDRNGNPGSNHLL